ncbi:MULTISPECIES: LysR family transcriptional regulator [Mesorhizobium]|uniref:LysR family transcriptional regulator n=1 Tax=Mesorhizobium denitrificans TaxID=2294114 RepID=A0A371X926_9HYPH|nr:MULTISPECIES: LysR family transcriptional regulator [Mesorhizobium]RFC65701.1 LysR family transcriptional regulator [Mesorhizobium denitrificans]
MARFDWDDLQYFLAVARSGTLSAASRELRTNHVTVSRRIDRLEQALGRKLFERNPRGYVLTNVGDGLLESAKLMAQQAETFRSESRNDSVKIGGVVRFSSLEGFGSFFLADRLPEFCRANPSIHIEMITIQQIVSLSRREADLSITLAPPQADHYHNELISPYQLFLYGSRSYLNANPPIKDSSDLNEHDFVGYISDMIFTPGLDYLNEIAPGIRPHYQCSSLHAQVRAAIAGLGLVVLPAFIASDIPELVPVLPEELRVDREYWSVTHRELATTPRVRMLIEFLKSQTRAAASRFNPHM